jgi:hypothetical protein
VSRLSKFNAVWASNQYQRCFDASHGRCHISSEACCRGRPLLLSSRRSATAVDVAPRFSLLASAISSEARGSARKGKAVGTPLRERGQRPGHDAVRGPSPSSPTGESHSRSRSGEQAVRAGRGEDFGRPVVALVGRDCRIEPGEVVIARLTKLSRSVAGQLVVVRGARAGCDGLADAWEDIGDQHRVRACGDVRLRCEGAGRVGKSPPPERLGATAWILPYRASTHGVIGPTLSLVIELYAERRDRQLHLPGRSKPASRQPSRRPTRRCSRSGGWCCAAPPSRRRQRR